jgi:hypothetical protein
MVLVAFAAALLIGAQAAPAAGSPAPSGAFALARQPSSHAVIRGRILDADGTPASGATVQALRVVIESGQRMLFVAATGASDDQGRFELSGLDAGRYLLAAKEPGSAKRGDADRVAAQTPTYYPGVGTPDEAVEVKAETAPDATPEFEFRLQRFRPVDISGQLLTYDGKRLRSAAVILSAESRIVSQPLSEARIRPDGTFTFSEVPPGRYVLRARGETARDGASLFATFSLAIQGQPAASVTKVVMTLTPGAALEGRLEVEARHAAPLPALESLRVRAPLADGAAFGDTLSGTLRKDGTFRLAGLMPGTHVLMVEGLTFPWRVAEARIRGRDAVEHAFDVERDQIVRGVRIVVSDTAAGVSGTVASGPDASAGDVLVIAFPADALRRRLPLRFVRVGRVAADGGYRVVDLAAGPCLVAAVRGATELDAMNAALLDRLAAVATPVQLSEGQVARTPLQVVAVPPGSGP